MCRQIIEEGPIGPRPHEVAITFRDMDSVSHLLDGTLVRQVDNVGVPLGAPAAPGTGAYPSYGPGELFAGKIRKLTRGHGME